MAGSFQLPGLIAFSAAIFLAACATPTSHDPSQTLAMSETPGGLFEVEAEVNGEGPYRLLVDTGSERSAIDPSLAKALTIPIEPDAFDVYSLFAVEPVSGSSALSLTAGRFSNQTEMMVMRMHGSDAATPPDGIIGIDALLSLQETHRYLVMDFHQPGLIARTGLGSDLRREIYEWHRLRPANPSHPDLLIIDVSLGGVDGKALLDSGLRLSVMNEAFADALVLRQRASFVDLLDAHGEVIAPLAAPSRSLEAMGLNWDGIRLLVHDAEAFKPLGLADGPAMLIGADLLSHLTIVIDTELKHIAAIPRTSSFTGPGLRLDYLIGRMN